MAWSWLRQPASHQHRCSCVSVSTCACASPRQIIINVSITVRVMLPCHTSHLAALPGRAACASSPVQPSAQIVAPAPCSSSVDQAHQFIREAPNTTSMIRVPSGPGWKAESKLYPSFQSHRMQYLRGRVGVFAMAISIFFSKKQMAALMF